VEIFFSEAKRSDPLGEKKYYLSIDNVGSGTDVEKVLAILDNANT
jgi:hypothetical protein